MKINYDCFDGRGRVYIKVNNDESIKYQECVLNSGGYWANGEREVMSYSNMVWLCLSLRASDNKVAMMFSSSEEPANVDPSLKLEVDNVFIGGTPSTVCGDDYDHAMGVL